MINSYLLLWLEAPMQSWGSDSKFGRRNTLDFPTKSGVLGLLCCALGASGKQAELLAKMAQLSQTVISFVSINQHSNEKNEPSPTLRDFHMIGAGYNLNDPWQALLEPHKSNGKARTSPGGGAKITYRYYLQDAFFAIAMEVPQELAELFSNALQNPAWDLYLGRKNCAPTDFIYRGSFATEFEAINAATIIAKEKNLTEDFRVIDGAHEGSEVIVLNDVPIHFGENKQYRDRHVTIISS